MCCPLESDSSTIKFISVLIFMFSGDEDCWERKVMNKPETVSQWDTKASFIEILNESETNIRYSISFYN